MGFGYQHIFDWTFIPQGVVVPKEEVRGVTVGAGKPVVRPVLNIPFYVYQEARSRERQEQVRLLLLQERRQRQERLSLEHQYELFKIRNRAINAVLLAEL